ncbi:MAG: hypothetical protein HYU53_17535 [Acidobacteria bacterium]|nr:hypothetical protein [Acidobacteriota bacterium]
MGRRTAIGARGSRADLNSGRSNGVAASPACTRSTANGSTGSGARRRSSPSTPASDSSIGGTGSSSRSFNGSSAGAGAGGSASEKSYPQLRQRFDDSKLM